MAELKFSESKKQDGVFILSEINDKFELTYIKVREKEKRIYSDVEVERLPFASISNLHRDEWSLRIKSFSRFQKYLKTKNDNLNILDLGCGNGWFAGKLVKDLNSNFFCVDINLTELKQAARIFNSDKLKFIYADIFTAHFPKCSFNLIILNASVQYFSDIHELFSRLFELLTENGEIHIIDSPFYLTNDVICARDRTINYYSSISLPEMARYYHHHSYDKLSQFNIKKMYDPSSVRNKIGKWLFTKDSPFPWIVVKK